MKVAIKISSTQNDNQFRGIGFYTHNLIENLEKLENENFSLISFSNKIPKADLYHFPDFNPFFFSIPLTLINQSIITVHDLIPIEYKEYYPAGFKANLRWQIQKNLLKSCPQIITDSKYSQNQIAKFANISKKKITPIYLAPGNSFFKTTKPKTDIPKKFILYVGDLNWNKNIMMLAKVCVELNISLVVVGKQAVNSQIDPHHPWNKELVKFQQYAKENSKLITCLGFIPNEELSYLYQKAFCYICPSISEGFGFPILEAMISGCPVISSNGGSLTEVGGEACLYFNPLVEDGLKSQIKKLFNNLDLRKNLITKGLNRAKQFSWQETARQTLNAYQKALKHN